ncbi:flagellar basal body rod C-terminal domain-containing protein [Methylobacterium sp. NEAU K]|uniref:flagellar basal body rod C-terminal domain-containing protein n=1 Tax=Methylobacterium sp. NEAU K TaxID=3064946 RepID=UPI002734F18F|nr:flagellar basal body rod C-terminal domain-containing protein [Methylobacterium sp. NEAU K]MDP4002574.1 flagellar basal body rod C-terminal domain-containing protein [Methylobacterium sp. NEAU K]
MIDALQTATAGMTRATDRLGTAARTIAASGARVGDTALPPAAQVDLSSAAADLIGSQTSFALNAAVARTADRMTGKLLDISA